MKTLTVNKNRLKSEFLNLVKISSESKNEKRIAEYIADIFRDLADEIIVDDSSDKTKSNTNNLIIKIAGNNPRAKKILLCSHLDTVVPGNNVKPVVYGDTITSDGSTVLGGDCKSGIAIIIEVIRTLKEAEIPHGDIELLFTVAEEVGLLGAKHLDYSLIDAKLCYALDTSGVMTLVHKAPSANDITFKIFGKAAHAGLEPEKGVNALKIAAQAISMMQLGRIDHETTTNIGTVSGGKATNIVPDYVELRGEARSHSSEKLKAQTDSMRKAVERAVADAKSEINAELPRYEAEIELEYEHFDIDEDEQLITLAKRAATEMGKELNVLPGGGGSDANIFNEHGIKSVILSTGMDKVHTMEERIDVNDMVENANLLLNVLVLIGKK